MNSSEPSQKNIGEFLSGILLIAVAAFVIIEALRMPRREAEGFMMSPGFVPLLAGSALLMLSLSLAARGFGKKGDRRVGQWLRECIDIRANRRFLVLLVIMGLYTIVLVGRIPFFAATLIFHLLIFRYLKIGSPFKIALFSLLAALFVAVLLPAAVGMQLP